jgi:hypothetical protein
MGGVQTASWKSIPNGPRYLTLIERWGLSLQTAHSHLIGPTGQCWMSTQTYSTILWGMQRRSRFKVNREFNMKLVFQLMWFLLSNWSSLKRLGLAPLLTTTSFCKTCQVASTYCSASSNSAHSYPLNSSLHSFLFFCLASVMQEGDTRDNKYQGAGSLESNPGALSTTA